jgi:HEAT repeat protein
MANLFRPHSVRWQMSLVIFAAGFVLNSSCPPLIADETYEGKSFEHWVWELQDELSPPRRIEAIRALTAFAAREKYRTRVCEVILDAMRDYDVERLYDEDEPVVKAAHRALGKVGSASDESVLKELKEGPPQGRRFAIAHIELHLGKRFIPALRDAIDDKDAYVCNSAVDALVELRAEEHKVVPILLRRLVAEDGYPSASTLRDITALGPAVKDAVPALVAALKKPQHNKEGDHEWIERLQDIIVALMAIGSEAKEAISAISEFAERGDILGKQAKYALEKLAKKP